MTWFRIDDSLTGHEKWLGLGIYGRSLWLEAGVWSARFNADGVLSPAVVTKLSRDALVPAELHDETVDQLVKVQLWQRRSKSAGGGFLIVNWLEYQPSRDEVTKKRGRWARMKRLHRDPGLIEEIKRRDGDQCRYCARPVKWRDNKTAAGAVYDHVDPNLSPEVVNSAENVVVACRSCNSRKNERTPTEAGMTLLPAPVVSADDRKTLSIVPRIDDVSRTDHGTGSGDGSGRAQGWAGAEVSFT